MLACCLLIRKLDVLCAFAIGVETAAMLDLVFLDGRGQRGRIALPVGGMLIRT